MAMIRSTCSSAATFTHAVPLGLSSGQELPVVPPDDFGSSYKGFHTVGLGRTLQHGPALRGQYILPPATPDYNVPSPSVPRLGAPRQGARRSAQDPGSGSALWTMVGRLNWQRLGPLAVHSWLEWRVEQKQPSIVLGVHEGAREYEPGTLIRADLPRSGRRCSFEKQPKAHTRRPGGRKQRCASSSPPGYRLVVIPPRSLARPSVALRPCVPSLLGALARTCGSGGFSETPLFRLASYASATPNNAL
ncbi:hypothetical protein K458DRAFT_386980 [Lentithecium fluviatile CBS 122367]|uniref:Uncharacterized protein n=1 Tax=Lentithecium fluviatile CBS 122367 TaxID=1168545 RepID=A0A6G1J632_9PLEO|nr:hypothetical protein K458DRAFT_386980 [Lentithecium fluviatile CBS 122367]